VLRTRRETIEGRELLAQSVTCLENSSMLPSQQNKGRKFTRIGPFNGSQLNLSFNCANACITHPSPKVPPSLQRACVCSLRLDGERISTHESMSYVDNIDCIAASCYTGETVSIPHFQPVRFSYRGRRARRGHDASPVRFALGSRHGEIEKISMWRRGGYGM
jgi:hypothetical protein